MWLYILLDFHLFGVLSIKILLEYLLCHALHYNYPNTDSTIKRTGDHLMNTVCQNGHPLEQYVEEFLEYSHLVSWSDTTLSACIRMELDELFQILYPGSCYLAL